MNCRYFHFVYIFQLSTDTLPTNDKVECLFIADANTNAYSPGHCPVLLLLGLYIWHYKTTMTWGHLTLYLIIYSAVVPASRLVGKSSHEEKEKKIQTRSQRTAAVVTLRPCRLADRHFTQTSVVLWVSVQKKIIETAHPQAPDFIQSRSQARTRKEVTASSLCKKCSVSLAKQTSAKKTSKKDRNLICTVQNKLNAVTYTSACDACCAIWRSRRRTLEAANNCNSTVSPPIGFA